jgi:hypothetical protein
LLTFQPAVSDEGIRSGAGQRFGDAGAFNTQRSALSSQVSWIFSNGGLGLHGIG